MVQFSLGLEWDSCLKQDRNHAPPLRIKKERISSLLFRVYILATFNLPCPNSVESHLVNQPMRILSIHQTFKSIFDARRSILHHDSLNFPQNISCLLWQPWPQWLKKELPKVVLSIRGNTLSFGIISLLNHHGVDNGQLSWPSKKKILLKDAIYKTSSIPGGNAFWK